MQETLVRPWTHRSSVIEETKMIAWLCTILRNLYFSQYRKREVPDIEGIYSNKVAIAPGQTPHMEMLDRRVALARLPDKQREALLLVDAAGHAYVQVAEICGCAIGAIKSRRTLAATVSIDPVPDVSEASDVPVTKGGEEASQRAYASP